VNTNIIRSLVKNIPELMPHLTDKVRWIFHAQGGEYKTYDYFLNNLTRLIQSVYDGNLGGGFIDTMANLISGQLTQAFEQAWSDEEGEGGLPDYLSSALEDMILGQYDHVDQFYRDIVDARVDQTPIDPLLARAPLWAQRWIEAYNQAVALITTENGGNLIWQLGETEQHCASCSTLNGIVARASEWEELGVRPQGAPNALLECDGWHCDCSLSATDKRRSPKAYESIMNAVNK